MMGFSLRRGVDDGGEGGRRPPRAFWVFLHLSLSGILQTRQRRGERRLSGSVLFTGEKNGGRAPSAWTAESRRSSLASLMAWLVVIFWRYGWIEEYSEWMGYPT